MPGIGIDPRSIRAITMRGFAEPDVKSRMASAALRSSAWRSRTKVVGGAEKVVQDLLNSLRVYDPFNVLFEQFGSQVKVEGVEKVASTNCLELKLSDSACNAKNNERVPVGANLRIAIIKRD
jgi:hypothetical protein